MTWLGLKISLHYQAATHGLRPNARGHVDDKMLAASLSTLPFLAEFDTSQRKKFSRPGFVFKNVDQVSIENVCVFVDPNH